MARRKKTTQEPKAPEAMELAPELTESAEEPTTKSTPELDATPVAAEDAASKAPELAPPENVEVKPFEPESGTSESLLERIAEMVPDADALFEKFDVTAGQAAAVANVMKRSLDEIREVLAPGLVPEESIQVSSTAEGGHWRAGRRWHNKPELFDPSDPFLTEDVLAALKSDKRIRIVFPR